MSDNLSNSFVAMSLKWGKTGFWASKQAGCPWSHVSRTRTFSGTSQSTSHLYSSANFCTPSLPNRWCSWPQFVHTNELIFWTRPRMGTSTFVNISMPRRASNRAMSCGVETTMAPFSLRCWLIESWTSPVPFLIDYLTLYKIKIKE